MMSRRATRAQPWTQLAIGARPVQQPATA